MTKIRVNHFQFPNRVKFIDDPEYAELKLHWQQSVITFVSACLLVGAMVYLFIKTA